MKQILKYLLVLALASISAYAVPDKPNIPLLDSSSESGVSLIDNITNKTTLLFTGSKESNETITLYVDGVSTDINDTSSNTSYSITITNNVDGSYLYSVIANDGIDNSPVSDDLNVTIDTVAPIAGIVTDTNVTADNIVNFSESQGNVTLIGTATGGDIQTGDTVSVDIGGNISQTTVDSNGDWSVLVSGSNLANDTSLSISVKTFDIAGNSVDSNLTRNYSVDLVFVEGSITINDITADNVVNGVEILANIDVNGTASTGDVSVGDTVTLSIDATNFTTTVNADNTWGKSIAGSYFSSVSTSIAVTVDSSDSAGNTGTTSLTKNYTQDFSVDANITINPITNDNILNIVESEGNVSVSGSTAGEIYADDNVSIRVNGVDYNTTVSVDLNWSVNVLGSDLNNTSSISASIVSTDPAGNTDTTSQAHNYNKDVICNVNIDSITQRSDGFALSYDVIGSTDIEFGREIIFSIDGVDYTTTSNGTGFGLIISNQTLNLTDGTQYTVAVDTNLTDAAGNIATPSDMNFTYDIAGETRDKAKKVKLSDGDINAYLNTSDVDYYIFNMSQKGLLNLDTNVSNINLELFSLDDTQINEVNASSVSMALDKGSYLIKISSTYVGGYILSSSTEFYDKEIDSSVVVNTKLISGNDSNLLNYNSNLYIDGGLIYTGSGNFFNIANNAQGPYTTISALPKFFMNNGNYVYAQGGDLVVQSHINRNSTKTFPFGSTNTYISSIGDIAYVLENNNSMHLIDVSNPDSMSISQTITLPIITNSYSKFTVHKDGSNTYLYALDDSRSLFVYNITTGTPVLESQIDYLSSSTDITIDNGLLYIGANNGVYIFDINTLASSPKLMKKLPLSYATTAVVASNNKLYLSRGSFIESFDVSLDYEDNVSSELSLNRLTLNSTTNMNKYSGKNDVDIFRIDLVNSGDLNLTTADVNSTNLRLSVSVDSNFSTTLVGANDVDFINQSIILNNLEAKTYYIKIATNDSTSFDNYTLKASFTKATATDVIDALLNISISASPSVQADENITSSLDNLGNDVDLYRIDLSSDGALSIDNPDSKTVAIYTADIDTNSSYASLTQITTDLLAGTYYIKVSGADGNYTIIPRFASYADGSDEYISISVTNVAPTSMDGEITKLDIRDAFLKTGTTLLSSMVVDYGASQDKNYLSNASSGKYIYAMYKYINAVDSSIEIGIDIFEYINDTNIYHVGTKVLPENSSSFPYAIRVIGDKLILKSEVPRWVEYDISDPINIPDSSLVFLAAAYLDYEVHDSKIYAVDGSRLDVLDVTTKVVLLTTDIANSTSVTIYDDLVYVSTTTEGIKVFKLNDLSLIKEITNIQNVTYLQSNENKLYLLDDASNLQTMDIKKDYSDDFANATLIFLDNNITGAVSSSSDEDYFKVNLDFTGNLVTSLSGTSTCTLYDNNLNLVSAGSCTQTVAAGTYYLNLSHTSASAYILNASLTPISSDKQDTLRFYSGDTTNLTSTPTDFNASIDALNDVDYFKITLDTTGLLDLNVTNSKDISLVYENGAEVTKVGSVYNIVVSGEYFIKVTSTTATGAYDVSASFESIIDDKYVDTPLNFTNQSLSSLKLRGDFPKVISSGDILYWVDELDGLSVINVGDVLNPIITSRVSLEGTPQKLFLDGSILYVALGDDGFAIIDVSNSSGATLYTQTNVSDSVNSLVANGTKLFLTCTSSVKKFDLFQPASPVLELSVSASSAKDMVVHQDKLLITQSTGVAILNQSDLISTGTMYDSNSSKIVRDSGFIFVQGNDNNIEVFDSNLSDTDLDISLSDTGSVIEDMYVNNKILYISKNTGYDIVEYKDLSSIKVTPASGALKSLTLAQNSLMLAKTKELKIIEATPDYPDTLRSQNLNEIDLEGTQSTTGIFAIGSDVDVFKYTNVNYTGSLDVTLVSDQDINVSIYNSNFELLDSAIDTLSTTINAGEIYLVIKPDTGVKSSYEFSHIFKNDTQLDVLDLSLAYTSLSMGTSFTENLYKDGKDKDYYKLVVEERGKYSFTTDNANAKVSLLYPSATTIASNYDEDNKSIKLEFDADLAPGDYYVLVENADKTITNTQDYTIETSLGETGEIILDSGASYETLSSISAYSHTDRYSYMLKDGTINRMSNILESQVQVYDNFLDDNDSVYKMFTYKQDNEEYILISRVSNSINTDNKIIRYRYDLEVGDIQPSGNIDIPSITSEEIMLIDEQQYIYYYDTDSLYISPSNDIDTAELLALEKLSIVKVSGNYMYTVTSDNIQIYDVSDKTSIDASKLLDTIYVDNVKSIYIDSDSNRLFVGANEKVEIWNISDKEAVTKISEFNIGFNEKDLYYKGTPTGMYLFDSKLYAAVSGVGLIFFDLDEFNVLSIEETVLNLGEDLSEIYTYRGVAINYVVSNELKVYFRDSQAKDAGSSGTYNIVPEGSVSEGSETFEGCFIATAAYGSYFNPSVKVLRDFRDDYLMHNEVGRLFVDFYYENSPSIAKSISDNEFVKSIIRIVLMPIVYFIQYPLLLVLLMSMFFIIFRKGKFNEKNNNCNNICI